MKTKTTTLCIVLLTFLLSACNVHVTFNTDEDKIASAAMEIADFELPDGYSPDFSASFEDYSMVSYTPRDNHSHLYLIQSQNAGDADNLDKMLTDIVQGNKTSENYVTVLETRPVTVRDQETTLILSEATNGSGEHYYQALVAFEGKGGPALLEYSTTPEKWDIATVEAFVASIH